MSPEAIRAALEAARYNNEPLSPEIATYIRDNPSAQAIEREVLALDAALNLDEDQPVRPGFDTRFFARLEDQKKEAVAPSVGIWQRLRWALAPVVMVGAAASVVLFVDTTPQPSTMDPDLQLALELELLEDYEVVEQLDELEELELLAQLSLDDFDDLESSDNGKVRMQ